MTLALLHRRHSVRENSRPLRWTGEHADVGARCDPWDGGRCPLRHSAPLRRDRAQCVARIRTDVDLDQRCGRTGSGSDRCRTTISGVWRSVGRGAVRRRLSGQHPNGHQLGRPTAGATTARLWTSAVADPVDLAGAARPSLRSSLIVETRNGVQGHGKP